MIKKLKGRPKLGNKPTLIRLSDETRIRLRSLIGDRGMAAFIREAVERELAPREKTRASKVEMRPSRIRAGSVKII